MDPIATRCEFHGHGVVLAADRWDPPTASDNGSGIDRKGVVLLLHGGGQTRHSWRNTGRRLATDGWARLDPDRHADRCHGRGPYGRW